MLVVFCVCIRLAFLPYLFSPLAFEKLKCPVIRGEYCRRNAQFRTHVGDRGTISNRKCINSLTVILDNLTYTTFDGMPPEHFQDYVLPAPPDSDHAQRATHRGGTVGTQERLAGRAEAFQMNLM